MQWRTKPALTRQAWLKELGRRLVWYFPTAQVKEVLSDYGERFDEGHDRSKTEAEIIQALGTPAEAAALLLLEEEPSARMNGLRQTGLWAAALALCCAFLWVCLMDSTSLRLLWTCVFLGLPLTASALFLLIRGPARAAVDGLHGCVSPAAVWVVPAALMLAIAVEKAVLYIVSIRVFSKLSAEELDRIGRSLRYGNGLFWAGIMLVLALLALWLLYRSVSASIRYFPGVIHTFGAIGSAFSHWAYFTSIYIEGDIDPMVDTILRLLPYCVGLATALVFQRWTDGRKPLPRVFRDGAVTWEDWQHRLGVGLLGWYDAPQAIEILEDYQEQYSLGREQGKTEDLVLSEMDRPEAVVRDLLKEDRKARLRPRKTWVWAVLAGISGWMLLGLLGAFELGGMFHWFMNYTVRAGVIAVVLGTASLYTLLHVRDRVALERRFPPERSPALWSYLPPLLLAAVTVGLVWYCTSRSWTSLKPYVYFVCWVEGAVLLLTALLIWTLARSSSASIRYFPAAVHAAGCAASLLCAGISLHSIDFSDASPDPARPLWCLPCLLPYAAGIVLALAVWLILRAAGKPRKEG